MLIELPTAVPAPIWRGAFRPLFLLAPAFAAAALLLWLASLSGSEVLAATGDPMAWHRHEMLFGFGGAAIAGFILTAVANWTGRPLIGGRPVQALVALWLAARATGLVRESVGAGTVLVFESGFYALLVGLAAREVVAVGNRNLPIVAMILLFGTASVADLAEAAGMIPVTGLPLRGGMSIIVLLMSLIGGRIIPIFTLNWLVKERLPEPHPAPMLLFDKVTLGVSVVLLALWAGLGDDPRLGWPLVGLGVLHLSRLLRWQGWRTIRDPLVVVLHLAYLWVPIGLVVLGAHLGGAAFPRSTAFHALGAGAMGLLIVAVMSRASLGHTGRSLAAAPMLVVAYALLWLGAAIRVATALFGWTDMLPLYVAGGFWATGMLLFVMLYLPILTSSHRNDPIR